MDDVICKEIYKLLEEPMTYQYFLYLLASKTSYLSRLPPEIIKFFLLGYLTVKTGNKYTLFCQIHSPKTIISGKIITHPAIITANGSQYWYQFNKLHRDASSLNEETDFPAIIYPDGTRYWYQNGQLHRDNDLPAIIRADGSQIWYKHNQIHRDNDLPAVIKADGTKKWFQHNQLHRDTDLPSIICHLSQTWYKHNQIHRDNDLPAIISITGRKEWWQNNKLHRSSIYQNGKKIKQPAIILPDGQVLYYKYGYENSYEDDS